MVLKVF